jgi:glycosyltransferase involved in cell wall biosynthesis
MVQVESMTCGTPVISTDLPGVRQPVSLTGMGVIVPPRNAPALAEGLIEILNHPNGYGEYHSELMSRFSPESVAAEYEELFHKLLED